MNIMTIHEAGLSQGRAEGAAAVCKLLERIDQLQRRADALQRRVEALERQQGRPGRSLRERMQVFNG
jgi:prefoldin subunit 5